MADVNSYLPMPLPPCPVHKDNNYKGSIYMVFDYAEYDLTGFMESQKCRFPEAQVSWRG